MISFNGFNISWLKRAEKQLNDLETQAREKIIDKIDLLVHNAEQLDIKKLQGYVDLYRISCGDYRIIFKMIAPAKIIIIAFICHRRDVYKKIHGI